MSLDGAATTLIEKERQYLNKLKDALVENGSQMQWVSNQVNRNIVSLNACIEGHVFGEYSDFNVDYPQATSLTKARILKAIIGRDINSNRVYTENDIVYHLDTITESLEWYTRNSMAFTQALDAQLTTEIFSRRIPIRTILNNTDVVFYELSNIALLQTMQRFLDESEQKDEELQGWLNDKRERSYDQNLDLNEPQTLVPRINFYKAIFGAANFSAFYRNESVNIRRLITTIKDSFTRSRYQQTDMGIIEIILRGTVSLLRALQIVLGIGRIGLMPYRLLQVAMTELTAVTAKLLRKLLSLAINPQGRAANIIISTFSLAANLAIFIMCANYLNIPHSYFLNLHAFPISWSWNPIFIGYAAYASVDFGAFLTYKSIDIVRKFMPSIRSFFRRDDNERNQENNIGIEITLQQRRSLIALLMTERPAQSQENKRIINQELVDLSNTNKLYYLSELDKTIIQNKNRGAEFGLTTEVESIEAQVLPLAQVQGSALSDRQRHILARLLIINRHEETFQDNQGLISTELHTLGYRSTPYYLSTLDRGIISRENREAEFGLTGVALQSTPLSEDETSLSPSLPKG